MGSVAIIVFVSVIRGNSPSPRCPSFEFCVVDIDTSVNDVDIDTLATETMIFVLGESAERELQAVADARDPEKRIACR